MRQGLRSSAHTQAMGYIFGRRTGRLLLKQPTKILQSATTVLETIASKWFLDIFQYGKSGNSIEKDRARSSTPILGCLYLKLPRSVLQYKITKTSEAVCNHELWHLWSLVPCPQRAPSPQSSGHRGRSNNLPETGWPTRQPLWRWDGWQHAMKPHLAMLPQFP